MRFGLITSSYPRTPQESINAGVFVRDFALELSERGHPVSVFTPAKGSPMQADPGIDLYTFPWAGQEAVLTRLSPRDPRDLFRMAHLWIQGLRHIERWAQRQKLERVLAFWAIPSGYFGLRLKRSRNIPLDVWALGSDIWKRKQYPFGERVIKQVLQGADRVFADGMGLQNEAQSISMRPVSLLRSMRRLPAPSMPKDLSTGVFKFLFVGRWDRVKGLDVFIEAFLSLPSHLPIEAHVFGQGPMESWLRNRLQEVPAGRVLVHGITSPDRIAGYLCACDCLVISSRQESLPVIFSDAMQCGSPVIGTDMGDLRHYIEGQKVGLVVPPEDPGALSEAMLKMLQTRKQAWAPACQALAKQFDFSATIDEYLKGIL